jgi:hypothetical protein
MLTRTKEKKERRGRPKRYGLVGGLDLGQRDRKEISRVGPPGLRGKEERERGWVERAQRRGG